MVRTTQDSPDRGQRSRRSACLVHAQPDSFAGLKRLAGDEGQDQTFGTQFSSSVKKSRRCILRALPALSKWWIRRRVSLLVRNVYSSLHGHPWTPAKFTSLLRLQESFDVLHRLHQQPVWLPGPGCKPCHEQLSCHESGLGVPLGEAEHLRQLAEEVIFGVLS